MNIILIQESHLKKGLEDLGHRVVVWDECHQNDTSVHIKAVLDELAEIRPDVILQIESLRNRLILEGIEEVNVLTAFYALDIHLNYYWHKEYAKLFDVVLVSQKDYIPRLKKEGIQNAYWFPWAIDPDVLKDHQLARDLDISFVGMVDDHHRKKRAQIIKEISGRFHLHLFGTSMGNRIPQSEMARVFSRSKIILNESIAGELNFRVFEALACGGMLLTERVKNGIQDLFQDGIHLITYGPENLPEKIEYYLHHEEERRRIAQQGKEQVYKYHTIKSRAEELTGILKKNLENKPAKKFRSPAIYGKTFFYLAQRKLLASCGQGLTKAIVYFQRAIEKEGSDSEGSIFLAIIYLGLKEYRKASIILQEIRAKEPAHFQANIILGHLLWEMDHREEAKRIFQLLFQIHGKQNETMGKGWNGSPEDPRFHLILGDIYRIKGRDYDPGFIQMNGNFLPFSAMGYYVKGIAQHPHFLEYLQRVGEIYFKWKMYDLAARYFQYCVRLDPSRPGNWKYLGLSSLKCYDRETGIQALRQSYLLEPSNFLLPIIAREKLRDHQKKSYENTEGK
jgi:tetratricopeptide (TPR) repeat protein